MFNNKKTFNTNEANSEIIEDYINDYNINNKTCSPDTIRSKKQILRKLSHYLEKHTNHKSLKKATKEDLKQFFNNNKYVTIGSHNLTGSHLIPFYRWVYDIEDKHIRPKNMGWYETSSKRAKLRNSDPHRKDKLLLNPEEYKKIVDYSKDFYGQNKAIWETYYFSGFRPDELTSMNIEDVNEDKKENIVYVSCPKSKTCPRKIPLPEYPEKLIRYIGNHPKRNNNKAPLFFNLKGSTKLNRLTTQQIEQRFRILRSKLKLKSTLVIKSFRKTRATIMFNSDDPNINNDTIIGKYMGWSPTTIILRRQEYNLTNLEDLKKAICKKPMKSTSNYKLQRDLDIIDNKYIPKIKKLENENKKIKDLNKDLDKRVELARKDLEEYKINNDKNLNDTISYLSELINKTFFYDEFKNKHKELYDTMLEKDLNKTLTKKEWNDYKNFVDKEYEEYQNKFDIKTLNDIKQVKKNKIQPMLDQLK